MFLAAALASAVTGWILLRRRRLLTSPRVREREAFADLGWNPLGRRLAAISALALVVDIALFSATGLSLDWRSTQTGVLLLGTLLTVWLTFHWLPGSESDRGVAEAIFITLLLVFATNVASPLQYGAIALGSPFIDQSLAAADRWFGVSVADSAAWLHARPAVALLANVVYFSLLPQFLFTVIALAWLREREALWEFAFHFHVCLIVTVAALAIWPAVCAPIYYGITTPIDISRAMSQIRGLHDGTMTVVRFDQLEGLVSVPSFHAAGAALVTWAFRRRPRILLPLVLLNGGLILATFASGIHYFVDVVAAVPLLAASLAAYRWWGRARLAPRVAAADAGSVKPIPVFSNYDCAEQCRSARTAPVHSSRATNLTRWDAAS